MTMNQRNLMLLGLAIASMLMLNWFQSNGETIDHDNLLLPALKGNLSSLTRIEIVTSTSSFSLLKEKEEWVLAEKDAYLVDFPVLSRMLKGLSIARLVEKKTSKPEYFEALDLEDVSEPGSESILVSGYSHEYEFSVLVGKQADSRKGQFVRMSGEDQAWLIDKELEIDGSMISWLSPVVVDVESQEVVRVQQYDSAGILLFDVERSEEGSELVLKDIPSDRSLDYPSVTDELARSMVNLSFTDVSPHESSRWKSPSLMKFSLADGGTVSVSAEMIDGKRWLHLSNSDTQVGSETLASWDYEVTSYVFEDFTKSLDDLLAEKPE
jgi:hypothetical protein